MTRFAPPAVRALLQNVPRMKASDTISWDAVLRRVYGVTLDEVVRQSRMAAATKIAHEFAGHVMREGLWTEREEPEGRVISLAAYCLTHEQLVDIACQAYDAGRLERPRIEHTTQAEADQRLVDSVRRF